MKLFTRCLASFLISYLVTAFILCDINISTWNICQRVICVFCAGIIVVVHYYDDDMKRLNKL